MPALSTADGVDPIRAAHISARIDRLPAVAAIDVKAHKVTSPGEWLDCDLVASSGGYSPVVHLASHLGGKPTWREDILGFVPGEAPQKRVCCHGLRSRRCR